MKPRMTDLSERDLDILTLQLAGWNLSDLALYFGLTEERACHEMNRIHNIVNKAVDFSKFRGGDDAVA